jgi:hypothetical protein
MERDALGVDALLAEGRRNDAKAAAAAFVARYPRSARAARMRDVAAP